MIKTEIVEKLKTYREDLSDVTIEQIEKGQELAKNVKEFDHPEETLELDDLQCLSRFYEYQAMEESILLQNDPSVVPDSEFFTEEELRDELDGD
jgi:hypothetical protein